MKLPVLHEDDHLIVVNKPTDLLTVPDRHDPELPNLKHMLAAQHGSIIPVHRLDRPTTGVLVFAKTAEAHRGLSMQFEARDVEKVYLALVDGVPQPDEATIDEPIAPHPSKVGRMMVTNRNGKVARTDYKVMEPLGKFSLVGVQIFTGRTHQIRVHLAYIGYPLIVDPFYGKRSAFMLSEVKGRRYNKGKHEVERPLLSRVPLHASRLGFTHPVTQEWLHFETELPKDMRAMVKQLRKLG
ncbi:Dual-specificity RNA pseudouridine synthase RluA [Neolewinella maritima]|uniref:Pseudouridine synthase n=1 Tax=Neolewinella maritima TaxID=1383882 RepID=A0ABN8EZZ4_9BACT|nr:RluA family pseudouridine synthase [Neolewinella maritima]CAH0999561.1 Dual-specificity RNA pseudouridine synthase RluA [Neolewinella maritima]